MFASKLVRYPKSLWTREVQEAYTIRAITLRSDFPHHFPKKYAQQTSTKVAIVSCPKQIL